MNTKDKRPYKTMRLTDRHVPTWVIHGGPVHIAAFWSSESDAMYRCKELNDVHEAAIAELDKAPKALTDDHYRIIADRMVEEHRKYGDKLRPGHWADVAARKVASHLVDFGYLAPAAGLTVDVDELANIIRTVDGNRSLGAGALAEAILAAIEAKTRKP